MATNCGTVVNINVVKDRTAAGLDIYRTAMGISNVAVAYYHINNGWTAAGADVYSATRLIGKITID
jgi:hypothetical protein